MGYGLIIMIGKNHVEVAWKRQGGCKDIHTTEIMFWADLGKFSIEPGDHIFRRSATPVQVSRRVITMTYPTDRERC